MSLMMNNMGGVVQEAGTANLSEAPECCCSMFLFSFLCDVVLCWYLSSCAPFCFFSQISPTLMKLSFSSFSVNNYNVHVTTLVMRIKRYCINTAYE